MGKEGEMRVGWHGNGKEKLREIKGKRNKDVDRWGKILIKKEIMKRKRR